MARRKAKHRTTKKSRKPRPVRRVNARQQGMKFFRLGDYDQAIVAWEAGAEAKA